MQFYLSQVVGRPVRDPQGESIGKVADLIVAIGDRYPPVTGLVVRPTGGASSCPGRTWPRSTSAGRR